MGVKQAFYGEEEYEDSINKKTSSSQNLPSLDIDALDFDKRLVLTKKRKFEKVNAKNSNDNNDFYMEISPKKKMRFEKKNSILHHLEYAISNKNQQI